MSKLVPALVVGLCLPAGTNAPGPARVSAIAAAREAVLGMAEGIGDPKEIAKKHELGDIMAGFKLRAKNGIGMGPGAVAGNPKQDGIEAKIINLATRKLTADQLKAQTPDLIKMLDIAKAIGEIATADNYPEEARIDPKKWKKFNDEMIQVAKEAKVVIKSGDPIKVMAVFNRFDTICKDCHGFR
jgi:hypothetical protein